MSILVDIEKRLGSFLLKVQFSAENETVALLGASGCGKSMTLKCIAGIEKPDKGVIMLNGATLFDSEKRINLPPQKRRTGLLFQNYALFPNMTVLQNIRAGAKKERNTALREAQIRSMMEIFELTQLQGHYPHQLSGGQQQRTALARILVTDPEILLLDEPFSALDSHLRFQLEREVRKVIQRFGKTVILVSHDRDEVFRLSDKIAVMNNGSIDVFGSRQDVFAKPVTVCAARLTGCKNISPIKHLGAGKVLALDWDMELLVPEDHDANYAGIRMHDICAGPGENSYLCQVVEEIENPFSYTIMLGPKGRQPKSFLGWELDKEAWRSMRAKEVEIHLPVRNIALLKDRS